MTPDELFEARVNAVLIDFDLRRVGTDPKEVAKFIGRIFQRVSKKDRQRIVQAVIERADPPPQLVTKLPAAYFIERRRLGAMSRKSQRTKKHQRTGDDEKVSYSRWGYAQCLIQRVRAEKGMSLAEIGRAVKDSAAWGPKALEYNGMVAERDITKLEDILGFPRAGKAGRLAVGDRITKADSDRLAKILFGLREQHGWTHALIGSAIGVGGGQVSKIINKGGGSRPVLDRALFAWASVNNGDSPPTTAQRDLPIDGPALPAATPEPETPEPAEPPSADVTWKDDTQPVAPYHGFPATLSGVQKRLTEAAAELEEVGNRLPEAFRGPWKEKAEEIIRLAGTLQ